VSVWNRIRIARPKRLRSGIQYCTRQTKSSWLVTVTPEFGEFTSSKDDVTADRASSSVHAKM